MQGYTACFLLFTLLCYAEAGLCSTIFLSRGTPREFFYLFFCVMQNLWRYEQKIRSAALSGGLCFHTMDQDVRMSDTTCNDAHPRTVTRPLRTEYIQGLWKA